MRTMILGALTAAYFALPAAAQTTTCGPEFGKWVCRTQQPQQQPDIAGGGMAAFARGMAQGRAMREDRERAAQEEAARFSVSPLEAERNRIEAIKVVRAYIAAGQCDDARRVAMQYFGVQGDRDAQELCKN